MGYFLIYILPYGVIGLLVGLITGAMGVGVGVSILITMILVIPAKLWIDASLK